ncbi:MAG: cobalamin biosynthesis protein CbiG [Pseudomonadota bacterium]
MSALFDTYFIVDWSAASTPKRGADSIWWALHRRIGGAQAIGNPTTRAEAIDTIAHLLAAEADLGYRILVGFDFPFGYPQGFAERVTGQASALALWDWLSRVIEDAPSNANNRFEIAAQLNAIWDGPGPFWGRPSRLETAVPEKKTGIDYSELAERRLVERRQKSAQPVWKLFTTGSVGSQVLLGLPALNRLRQDPRLRDRITVWPFETGLAASEAPVTLAEIYPSLLDKAVAQQRAPDEIKDRAQVRVNAAAFAALDASGGLADLFSCAPDLTQEDRHIIETEEAWILGVGFEDRLREAA